MKRYFYLLSIIFFFSGFKLFAQIPTYEMSYQTVTGVCMGVFNDSDAGVSVWSDCYGNNENYTMTFCSGSTEPMSFIFSSLNIDEDDHLIIYDGPNTSSPVLYDITDNNYSSLTVTSSGPCITFTFTSDDSGGLLSSNGDWSSGFTCGVISPSDIAADECADAPLICDLDGYFGNTSSSYTPDTPGNMCGSCSLFDGSLENNSWISFIANNDTVVFTVTLLECSSGEGIQFGVYQGTNCDNFVLMTPVAWTSVDAAPIAPGSTEAIVATGLIPGQQYYIMIDGFAGDDCQYVIYGLSGIQFGASISPDQTICTGDVATINIGVSGSVPVTWTSNPPDASLAGQENNASITVSPTTTTTYTVEIEQTQGACSGDTILTSTVTVINAASVSFSPLNSVCIDAPEFQLTEGIPAGGTYSGSGIVNDMFYPSLAGAGTHTITYTLGDTNTACHSTASQTITVISNIVIGVNPSSVSICPGTSVTLHATGADLYTWSPPYGLNQTNGPIVQASPATSTIYTVTGSNSGCTGSNLIYVNVYNTSIVQIISDPPEGCEPLHVTMSYQPEALVVDSTWFWHFGDVGSANNISHDKNPEHIFASEGSYLVTFNAFDNNGCHIMDTTSINVYVVPNADFYNNPVVGFAGITNMDFIDASTDANYWLWDFGDPESHNFNTSDIQNPTHMYADSGTYTVQLIVTSTKNCSDTVIKDIIIFPEFLVYLPNAFTPNQDNLNDIFTPVISNFDKASYKIYIFDRWGREIFYSDDIDNGWDGKDKNKYAETGIYAFVIFFNELTGKEHLIRGHVTLVR